MRDCILIINGGAVNCRLLMIFKGRGLKMGVFVGGGGGGLTWTLILRIFGMVSITFFFAPPPLGCNHYKIPSSRCCLTFELCYAGKIIINGAQRLCVRLRCFVYTLEVLCY